MSWVHMVCLLKPITFGLTTNDRFTIYVSYREAVWTTANN